MIGVIVCMRDMSMKQKIDKNSNEASKEVQKEKSLDTTSEEQQRLKLEEETKAIHKQAELLLEDEKTSQEKIELSDSFLSDISIFSWEVFFLVFSSSRSNSACL